MGILADIFDVVRDGVTTVKDELSPLIEPVKDDLAYIWEELTEMGHGDDADD